MNLQIAARGSSCSRIRAAILNMRTLRRWICTGGVLRELLGRDVRFVDDVCGPAARAAILALRDGEILLLDNVRFMAEEMTLFERKLNLDVPAMQRTQVVAKLAPLGDLFVCDAFAAAHRAQPTLMGFGGPDARRDGPAV